MSIALIQAGSANTQNSTTGFVTLNGVTQGNTLIAFVVNNNNLALSSITDSAGGTIATAEAFTAAAVGGNYVGQGIYYILNAASGTHSLTTNYSAAANFTLFLAEYQGLASFDTAATLASGSSGTAATNSLTPSANGELILALMTMIGTPFTLSNWSGGFIQRGSYSAAGPSCGWASLIESGTNAISASATISGTVGWSAGLVAFAPPAAVPDTLLGQGWV